MLNLSRIKIQHLLICLAFVLGLVLRFYQLGAAPLADSEAQWANQALQAARSDPSLVMGSQPGYVLLTAAVFRLFGDSNFTARFWPALVGSFLGLAALFLIPLVDKRPPYPLGLVILSFGLAVDPGLVTISRQAGGPMLAVGFSVMAFTAGVNWRQGTARVILAGLAAGMALLSGPAIWNGTLCLALVGAGIALSHRLAPAPVKSEEAADQTEEQADPKPASAWQTAKAPLRLAAVVAGGTILLVGTAWMRVPQGLAAWLDSIQVFFSGWAGASGRLATSILAAYFFYELLPLVFAGFFLVRSIYYAFLRQEGLTTWQTVCVLGSGLALLLVLIYPARQAADLSWVIVFLWCLAAFELARLIPDIKLPPIALILAAFTFILCALFWITLAALSIYPTSGAASWLIPGGILSLAVLSTALVNLGWPNSAGNRGLVLGLTATLLVYAISCLWGAAYLRPNQPQEYWGTLPGTGDSARLMATLDDLSEWKTGRKGEIDIISTLDSPSLRWELRRYPHTQFLSVPPSSASPSIVITAAQQELPALAAAYTGQDFAWWTLPGWAGSLPVNRIQWFNYRKAPLVVQQVILWARTDITLGGAPQAPETTP